MPAYFGLRFDFRNPTFAGVSTADRYAAALDMVEWADKLGNCFTVTVSEHHGSDDGYLPSPLPMIAAMAARTTNVRFMIAALIAPFYNEVRLAEDLCVLSNLTRGRVDLIIAGGYVREEFDLYGEPTSGRAARVEHTIATLRSAFRGEPINGGLTIQPRPYNAPGITLGGSTEAAARRAARIADGFIPSVPEAWGFYREELVNLGKPDPGEYALPANVTIALAEDAELGWKEMGPYFLHESNAYGAWLRNAGMAAPYKEMADVDELRASGQYRVITPAQYVEELKAAPFPFALFHPMCGGIPPELAWQSLRLFETQVMPALA